MKKWGDHKQNDKNEYFSRVWLGYPWKFWDVLWHWIAQEIHGKQEKLLVICQRTTW